MVFKQSYQLGRVTVTEWDNATTEGAHYPTYTVQKAYKDEKTGKWVNTDTFSKEEFKDLLVVAQYVAQQNVKTRGATENADKPKTK